MLWPLRSGGAVAAIANPSECATAAYAPMVTEALPRSIRCSVTRETPAVLAASTML